VEYFELSQPFTGADRSEVTALDLCPPVAKGVEFGKLCANLSGYVSKSQMAAGLYFKDILSEEMIEDARQAKEDAAKGVPEDVVDRLAEAKSLISTSPMIDEEFGSKLIEKFNAVWQKDKQILQRDGKPVSDFDYKEIGFKDRLLIAAMYALVFMVG
jgi:hypothetical protein